MPEPVTMAAGAYALYHLGDYTGPEIEPARADAIELNMTASRGQVIPLTPPQRVARWRYLAGELPIGALDFGVRRDGRPDSAMCPAIYYRLRDHNGGKDPSAPDPATLWRSTATSDHVNRTSDCVGGAAWGAGFDRYQPARFAHIYGGWINTDSMIADALGVARCFAVLERPAPGCFIVAASGTGGSAIGHIGGVVDVPDGFDRSSLASWRALGVVDVAARDGRANRRTTGAGWFTRGARFIVSTMKP